MTGSLTGGTTDVLPSVTRSEAGKVKSVANSVGSPATGTVSSVANLTPSASPDVRDVSVPDSAAGSFLSFPTTQALDAGSVMDGVNTGRSDVHISDFSGDATVAPFPSIDDIFTSGDGDGISGPAAEPEFPASEILDESQIFADNSGEDERQRRCATV